MDRLTVCTLFKKNRICELPDDLLIHILSFVTMKEAGRTSSLAKRWRYVWAYNPYLNFDGCEGLREESEDEESLEEKEPMFFTWVDQVVNTHKAPVLDEFKVKFDLGVNRTDNIYNWLRFAMEKKVKKLEMDVAPFLWTGSPAVHTFPSLPFSNSLTFLSLSFVHVSGELLEKLLTSCQTLEFLSITHSNLLVDFKVVGPSLNLKSLAILYCFEIQHLEISAPNLEMFHYIGPTISSPFKSVPKLTGLTIGGDYADHLLPDLLDLSSFITQIEVLTIESFVHIKRMSEVFPICTRVKTLDIDINPQDDVQLFRLRFLLNACPMLHKFVLRLHLNHDNVEKTENTRNVEVHPHRQLKIIEIFEFVSWEVDTSFVMYLIESALYLEKMIITPTVMPTDSEEDVGERQNRAINEAKKLQKLKPGLVFQICD